MSPTVILPATTSTAARHIISVTAAAMISDLAADLRGLPFLHLLVVAVVFPALVVEILDRLEVDQAVHRAHVGRRVQFVDLAPQHRAPVGDDDGEGHVEHQRDQRDQHEILVVAEAEDA
jgi:hypothetical protein